MMARFGVYYKPKPRQSARPGFIWQMPPPERRNHVPGAANLPKQRGTAWQRQD
jgi:hypothetical protein